MEKELEKALQEALEKRLTEAYENDIRPKLIKDLDERKSEIIAGLVLHLMRSVDIEKFGSTLLIKVVTDVIKYE